MTNVGYGYQPQGVVDLASIQQNRERLKMLKQQQQQEQFQKSLETVSAAYKEMKDQEKYKKMTAEMKEQGYQRKVTMGPTGLTEEWEKPKEEDMSKILLGVIGGTEDLTKHFTSEQISQVAPPELSLGQAEGGQVLTPPGATFREGQIFSPEGERIGEYLPGYEPTQFTGTQPQRFREAVGRETGVSPLEARRKQILGTSAAPSAITSTQRFEKQLLSMAQAEAARRVGMMSGIAPSPKQLTEYKKKTEEIYSEYLKRFKNKTGVPEVVSAGENIDENIDEINW